MSRLLAGAALVAAAIVVAVVLLGSDGGYHLTAQFESSGRLVRGGDVRIAGRVVGSISGVDLADNGLVDVRLKLDDGPLPVGTRARIRAVGAATLTNNFVELTPGPSGGAPLRDGSVLHTDQTTGIVDIDAILASIDGNTRSDIRALTEHAGDVFAGSGAAWFNGMLAKLNPALGEVRGVVADLASDRAGLRRFVTSSAAAAQAIASRRPDVTAAVDHTAVTLAALDRQRAAIASALQRAPAVLSQARQTLADTSSTLNAVRPALRRVPAAAAAAGPFLDRLNAFLPRSRPVVGALNAQLPLLRRALASTPKLAGPASRALRSTATAFSDAAPILRGARYYAPDFLIGLFNGLLTIAAGNYTKYGHYLHASFVQSPQDTLGGIFAGELARYPLVPGVISLRRGFTAMCPGAANPPAPDRSNVYVPDPSLCNPAEGLKADINQP